MLPIHDVAPIEDLVRKRMGGIEQTMNAEGRVAFAPGSYALGIGHLALGELDTARERLQAAWDSGHRSPELEGALGQVLGEIYLREAETAARIRNSDLRVARQAEIEEELLEPAMRLLEPDRGPGERRDLHRAALAALLVQQFDLALDLARSSYERHPWMYESMRLEAEVLVSRAKTLEERGRLEEARTGLRRCRCRLRACPRGGTQRGAAVLGRSRTADPSLQSRAAPGLPARGPVRPGPGGHRSGGGRQTVRCADGQPAVQGLLVARRVRAEQRARSHRIARGGHPPRHSGR